MQPMSFALEEATIADIHKAMRNGTITSRSLCEQYIERIQEHDQQGAQLNAIVSINEHCLRRADMLDEKLAETGELTGALHGIPVLVKDNIETTEVDTTCGSRALQGYRPNHNATTVNLLHEAGAIVLAKTTLPDFASSWFANSSISGETKNPYSLDHDPGGSSSGTAAGIAANLGTIGIGTDCGGSARLPASFCNLVCVRGTPGMISRAGSSLLIVFQDTVSPMARTVTDAVKVFDTLAGYDERDSYTTDYLIGSPPRDYSGLLDEQALDGAKLGLPTNAQRTDSTAAEEVNRICDQAIDRLRSVGAEIVEFDFQDLEWYIANTSLYSVRGKYDINSFLAERPELAGLTLQRIDELGERDSDLDLIDTMLEGPDNPTDDPEFFRRFTIREEFTRRMVDYMGRHQLDSFIYPTTQLPAPTTVEGRKEWTVLSFPTNTVIGSQTWTPSISVPAGFTGDGLPVGLEFQGKPYDEPTVFRLGYAFEQATACRIAPDNMSTEK